MLKLPEDVAIACAPLFERIPWESAMSRLQGSRPVETSLVEEILNHRAMSSRPDLAAALWLYVDDLERSHAASQSLPDPTGSYWHGIMHRREGDFSNSQYWMRRAAGHPLLKLNPGLDPAGFVDEVAADAGRNQESLVQRQRDEWRALFEWCAANPISGT